MMGKKREKQRRCGWKFYPDNREPHPQHAKKNSTSTYKILGNDLFEIWECSETSNTNWTPLWKDFISSNEDGCFFSFAAICRTYLPAPGPRCPLDIASPLLFPTSRDKRREAGEFVAEEQMNTKC